MKLRTVKLIEYGKSMSLEWKFEGTFQEAEKDLREFCKKNDIVNWVGIISDMTGMKTIRD